MVKDSKGSGVALVVAIVVVLILCFVAAYFIPLGVYAEKAKANTTFEFEDNQNIILFSHSVKAERSSKPYNKVNLI